VSSPAAIFTIVSSEILNSPRSIEPKYERSMAARRAALALAGLFARRTDCLGEL
jgi:hypothetical protein